MKTLDTQAAESEPRERGTLRVPTTGPSRCEDPLIPLPQGSASPLPRGRHAWNGSAGTMSDESYGYLSHLISPLPTARITTS